MIAQTAALMLAHAAMLRMTNTMLGIGRPSGVGTNDGRAALRGHKVGRRTLVTPLNEA